MGISRMVKLLWLSVLSFASLNAQNLIANPGFENGLTSWTVTSAYYWNTAVYSPDPTIRHTGNFSVRGDESNDSSLGALQQNLTGELVAGRTYVLSGWIKTQNVADGGGAIMGLAYVDQYGAAPADGGVLAIGFQQGTQDWTFYQSPPFTLKPMPSDTAALVVSLDFSAAHGTAWWDDLKLIQSCNAAQGPCISSPTDGANPQSQFVALSGTGSPGAHLSVMVDSVSLGTVTVDSEGNWEALAYISQLAFGTTPIIQVQDQATLSLSNTISVHITQNSFPPGPVSTASFLPLRSADIFVDGDPSSAQEPLYGPNYTHTALYLGGDADGNPWLAEAVTPGEAGIWGQVRALPLDQSLVWNALAVPGSRIAAFTPRVPLSGATRNAIVGWANNITKQGLPYWNASTDFLSPILIAYSSYVATLGVVTPRFTSVLNLLNANKNSTTKFICSTLVWRAYYEGTSHALDISSPNLMSAAPGSDLGNLPSLLRDSFIAKLADVLVVPETFVRNTPKLRQIF